jgi:hypothetical protein
MRSQAWPPHGISPPEGRARAGILRLGAGSALATAARHETFESSGRILSSNRLIKINSNRSIMPEKEGPAIKQNM